MLAAPPLPQGVSFCFPGVFGLPVRISHVCQIKSHQKSHSSPGDNGHAGSHRLFPQILLQSCLVSRCSSSRKLRTGGKQQGCWASLRMRTRDVFCAWQWNKRTCRSAELMGAAGSGVRDPWKPWLPRPTTRSHCQSRAFGLVFGKTRGIGYRFCFPCSCQTFLLNLCLIAACAGISDWINAQYTGPHKRKLASSSLTGSLRSERL